MELTGMNWEGIRAWAMVAATIGLTAGTLWLAIEVHMTRKSEARWRAIQDVAEGIDHYMGRYAEPGNSLSRLRRRDRAPGDEGCHLEVNRYGALFHCPEYGFYFGGYVEITEEGMAFELGVVENKARTHGTFRIGVLRQNRHREMLVGRAIQVRGEEGEASEGFWLREFGGPQWELEIKDWIAGEWKVVRKMDMVRYGDWSPKRDMRTHPGRWTGFGNQGTGGDSTERRYELDGSKIGARPTENGGEEKESDLE